MQRTYTNAELEVSPDTFTEIMDALLKADYTHVIDYSADQTTLDMNGIALVLPHSATVGYVPYRVKSVSYLLALCVFFLLAGLALGVYGSEIIINGFS